LRKEYGRDLAMTGGLDKRVLARDKDAIERELTAKLPVLLPQGGYIPELDHSFPPDVPWENFRYYAERKRELIEKG
jgi:uroporphyrinogen decarboxylase